jgi:hypothetical protein
MLVYFVAKQGDTRRDRCRSGSFETCSIFLPVAAKARFLCGLASSLFWSVRRSPVLRHGRTIAPAIANASVQRPGDFVARFGGEEFALLLPNTDASGAKTIAERARAAVMDLKIPHIGNPPLDIVTISLGVATVRSSGMGREKPDAGILVMAADGALYEAKRGGRNRAHSAPSLVSLASTWGGTSAVQSA